MSGQEREIGTEAQALAWSEAVVHNLSDEGQIVRAFDCPVENEERLGREVNRLAAKARKLGYTQPALYKNHAEHVVERWVTLPGVDGEPPTEVKRKVRCVRVVVAGPELRLNGWTVVAAVDWLAGKPVVRAVPGREVTPGMARNLRVHGPLCDHCNQKRSRNTTYILAVVETGEQAQVGSTCLLDFCGIDPAYAAQVAALYEAQGYQENLTRYEADLDGYLEWVAVAVRVKGRFVSRKQAEREEHAVYEQSGGRTVGHVPPTSELAYAYEQEARNKPGAPRPTEDDRAAVAAVKAHVATLDPSASQYEANLRSVFDSGILLPRHAGLAASAFGSYLREIQRVAEARVRADAARPSEYLGEPGERVTVRVKVVACHISEGNYGTTWIYRLLTPEGDRATWFSSNDVLDVGDEVTLVGTVKKLEEYRGERGTVLTRCRKV